MIYFSFDFALLVRYKMTQERLRAELRSRPLIIGGGHGAKRKKKSFGGSPKKIRPRGLQKKKKKKNYIRSI